MFAGKPNPPAAWLEGQQNGGEALQHVASATGVPVRTLQRAAFVEKHAIDEVKTSQTLTVNEAEEIARLKPQQQRKAVGKCCARHTGASANVAARC